MIALLLTLVAAAPLAPSIHACELTVGAATFCSEVKLGKDEAAKLLTEQCEANKGIASSHCAREKATATCVMGDTSLFTLVTATAGSRETERVVTSARATCSTRGGRFVTSVKLPAPKAGPKAAALEELTFSGAADCLTSDSFGVHQVTCGNPTRPEVGLAVSGYTGDEAEPQNPDDALARVVDTAGGSKVTELTRAAGPMWRVDYSLTPKHGAVAYGFHGVRRVGSKQYLCVGSAWSRPDLSAARAMCDSLKAR